MLQRNYYLEMGAPESFVEVGYGATDIEFTLPDVIPRKLTSAEVSLTSRSNLCWNVSLFSGVKSFFVFFVWNQ